MTQGEAGRCEGDGRVGGASQKLVSAEHYRQQIAIGSAQPLRGTTAARWVRLCVCLKNLGVCIPAQRDRPPTCYPRSVGAAVSWAGRTVI